jgi:hypothetical protein
VATAAILTIGNELVSGDVTKTNGGRLLSCLGDQILDDLRGHLRVETAPAKTSW